MKAPTTILGARLIKVIQDRKMTMREVSLKAGLSESGVKHIVSGTSKSPRVETIDKIAAVLGTTSSYLIGDSPADELGSVPLLNIPVIGKVQAGVWQDALELPFTERYDISLPDDGKYSGLRRYGLRVAGESMNRVFPAGSTVVVINFFDLGRKPRHGEYVVAERRADHGDSFEATVKAVEIRDDGSIWLWPKSTSPEFQSPLELKNADWENGDGWGIPNLIIKGLVVSVSLTPPPATF